MTIPLHAVTSALLAAVQGAAPAGTEVGDGEPPQTTTDRAYAWLTRVSAPATPRGFCPGERERTVRYRITCEATDTGRHGRAARKAAEALADDLRDHMLTGTRPSAATWQINSIAHDATATVAANRAFAVHDDYVVHIGAR